MTTDRLSPGRKLESGRHARKVLEARRSVGGKRPAEPLVLCCAHHPLRVECAESGAEKTCREERMADGEIEVRSPAQAIIRFWKSGRCRRKCALQAGGAALLLAAGGAAVHAVIHHGASLKLVAAGASLAVAVGRAVVNLSSGPKK